MKLFKIFYYSLYVLSFGVIVYSFLYGFDFYNLEFIDRPHHGLYKQLKPGGFFGHGYGIIGSTMLLFLLLYSLRKRTKLFGEIGTIRRWLDIHIYFGLVGPLLIILHTSFKLNGIVAISFWSMIAVALSGIIGRYLYIQIPHGIKGNEFSIQEMEKMDQTLADQIVSTYQVDPKVMEKIQDDLIGHVNPNKSNIIILFSLITSDLTRLLRFYKVKKIIRKKVGMPTSKISDFLKISKKKAILHRRILFLNKVHKLFHYWHVIHKPFAIIMYIIMIIHVVITVLFGYTWIF